MFLKYSEMWDMDLGGAPSKNEIPHWFGNAAYVVVGGLCKLLFRYRVDNRDKLRAFQGAEGALVICNHTSFFDVVFMYLAARPKQWVRLMGRDSLFDNAHGLLGQALSRVGAFPVKRDTADMTSIKRAVRMLKRQELVGILPEGTRRGKTDRVPSIHAGVSVIARMAKVPILPMTVRGVERIKQKGQRVHFPKVTVDYGDPILVGDFDFLPKDERVEACTWYAMRECFALYYRCAPEDVDMAALFPETRDYAPVFAEHPIPRHTSEELAVPPHRSRRESRQSRRESEGELTVEVIRAKRARGLLRGAAGAGYGRRGHRPTGAGPTRSGRSFTTRRWWADLAARGAEAVDSVGEIRWEGAAEASAPAEGAACPAEDVPAVVIRSHGVTPQVLAAVEDRGFSVVDATCPHVSRAQHAAAELAAEGCRVIVVGEAGHPEVEGLTAWAEEAGGKVDVVAAPEEIPEGLYDPVGVVAQTTQRRENLEAVVAALREAGLEPIVKNTICSATRQRQEAAADLASAVDAMVVIGGRNSSNTTRLAEVCALTCPRTFHIESADELDPAAFAGCRRVGVTAGASTPENQIAAVEAFLRTL